MAVLLSGRQVGLHRPQMFKDGNGWNVFTPPLTNHIPETVSDVIVRCGVREFR